MENVNSSGKKVRLKTDKLGFFKKLKVNARKLFSDLKKANKKDEDFKAFKQDMFDIIMNGIFGSIVLLAFGISFKIINILAIGAGLFLLSKKILPELNKVISSFNLIKINK